MKAQDYTLSKRSSFPAARREQRSHCQQQPTRAGGFNRAACRKLAEQLGVTQEYAEDHFAPKVPEFERVISFDGREELFVSDCGKLVIRRDGSGESVTPRQSVRWMQAWFERSPGGYDSDTEAFARWLRLVAAEMA